MRPNENKITCGHWDSGSAVVKVNWLSRRRLQNVQQWPLASSSGSMRITPRHKGAQQKHRYGSEHCPPCEGEKRIVSGCHQRARTWAPHGGVLGVKDAIKQRDRGPQPYNEPDDK